MNFTHQKCPFSGQHPALFEAVGNTNDATQIYIRIKTKASISLFIGKMSADLERTQRTSSQNSGGSRGVSEGSLEPPSLPPVF